MTSLIIIKIRFVCFWKDEVGRSRVRLHGRSHARSRTVLNDHRSCNHGITIGFFFGVSFKKQVIVKSYM